MNNTRKANYQYERANIMHQKAGDGDAVGKGRWSGVRHLEK